MTRRLRRAVLPPLTHADGVDAEILAGMGLARHRHERLLHEIDVVGVQGAEIGALAGLGAGPLAQGSAGC